MDIPRIFLKYRLNIADKNGMSLASRAREMEIGRQNSILNGIIYDKPTGSHLLNANNNLG